MKVRKYRYFSCDFETTVYEGQTRTDVWAGAAVELFTEDVKITHSIGELFEYLFAQRSHIVAYFHNLKFDGSFWLDFLLNELHFKQAFESLGDKQIGEAGFTCEWLNEKNMPNKSFKYSVSARGQWYTIIIKYNGYILEIRDSLKLLPYSVKKIGESFGTKHKKLDMEYKGFRYPGCVITEEEQEYIKNDVLVVKEALEIMQKDGHDKLTIGACCLEEFKKSAGKEDFDMFFPPLHEIDLEVSKYSSPTADRYIRNAYRGGWCYVVKGKAGKVIKTEGTTADVNSLYPSMMHSESGNRFPVGKPKFWKGNVIPEEALAPNKYYFIRVRTRFYLKPGKLPFIQIKGSFRYKGTECLESSDIYDPSTGEYYDEYIDTDGSTRKAWVEMTWSMTDFKLIQDHYDLIDFEILDGCYFYSEIGIFDDYINKYREIKMNSEGAKREQAKLFLNNLYGKLATSTDSSFKVAYIKPDQTVGFVTVAQYDKKPGHIAAGAAITSYARNFTIRAAQLNYYGPDKPGFIYADTDSIHCDLKPDLIKGIKVHESAFCCWKLENFWDEAIFTRQKTYIEHMTHKDCKPLKEPYYQVKCAGMSDRCKELFVASMTAEVPEKLNPDEEKFIRKRRGLEHFRLGLEVPGRLQTTRIPGGILLVEGNYKMR